MSYEETIVAGLVCFGSKAYAICSEHILSGRVFSDPGCGAVWSLCEALSLEGRLPRTAHTIVAEEAAVRPYGDDGRTIMQYIGQEWLNTVVQVRKPRLDELRVIAQSVAKAHRSRVIISAIQSHLAKMAHPGADAEFFAGQLVERLKHLSTGGNRFTAQDAAAQYEAEARRITESGEALSWGVPLADRVMPLVPGLMVVVSAQPGGGKTALATQVLHESCGQAKAAFISMEMTPGALVSRYTNRFFDYRAGVEERSDKYLRSPLGQNLEFIAGRQTPNTLARELRALAIEGVRLVVVDYIQRVKADDPKHTEYTTLSQASANIAEVAKETGLTVLVLSQFSREGRKQAAGKDGKLLAAREPQMSDLKGTGSLEEDADIVVGLWQPEISDASRVALRLKVMKNRYGAAGKFISTVFDMKRGVIEPPQDIPSVPRSQVYSQSPSADEDLFHA